MRGLITKILRALGAGGGLTNQVEKQAYRPEVPKSAASITDDEKYAMQAFEVRERWSRAQKEVERSDAQQLAEIKLALDRARQLVRKSGVEEACLDILKFTWHWPSWCQKPEFKPPIEISVTGGEARDEHSESRWIAWTPVDAEFKFTLIREFGYPVSGRGGHLLLEVAGEEVLRLDVAEQDGPPGYEYNTWSCFGVSGFRAGEWMSAIIDLAANLRMEDGRSRRAYEAEFYAKKAANIQLDER